MPPHLLERTLRAQLSDLLAQSGQLVEELLAGHEAKLQLWANEPLVHTIAKDPALAAVFLPGLRDYFDETLAREPLIHDVVILANGSQAYAHNDADPLAMFGGLSEALNPAVEALATAEGEFLHRAPGPDGTETTVLAMKRPLREDGDPIDGADIVLMIDLQALQSGRLDLLRPGEHGFLALMAADQQGVWLPDLAAGTLEVEDFRAAVATGEIGRVSSSGLETGAILLFRRAVGDLPLTIFGVGSQRDLSAPIYAMLTSSAVVGALILLFGVWAALHLARTLTAPLTALTDTMRQVAGGDLRVSLPAPSGTAELDRMADALAVFRDTALEIEENSLRDAATARQLLEDAIQSINEGFVLFDADDRLLLANARYRELLYDGVDMDLSPGTSFEAILRQAIDHGLIEDAKADPDRWIANRVDQHRNPGPPIVQRRSGDRWLMVSERRVAGGGTVAIFSDLTDLKQGEAKLRRTTDRLELALSMDGVGIWDANLETGEVWWSRKYTELLGHDPDSFAPSATTWEETLHPEQAPEIIAKVDALLDSSQDKARIPERMIRADGSPIWIDSHMSVTRDDQGKPLVLSGLDIDVSEQLEREQALSEANRQILSSVRYASRIQTAMLPARKSFETILNGHFLIWEPRDIVGGDFYWSHRSEAGDYVIVGDCTGHGVPGAFMTLITCGLLDRRLRSGAPSPAEVLTGLHRDLSLLLGQDSAEGETDDGLDAGVCFIPADRSAIIFSGAHFSLLTATSEGVQETKGDRSGVGYRATARAATFTDQTLPLDPDATYYLATDGLTDQVGGPRGRGFGKRRTQALLSKIHKEAMASQERAFLAAIADYQGDERRRDDLTILGFRVAPS